MNATKVRFEAGTVLYTRDGRNIGNSIVTGVETESKIGSRVIVYHGETDFGNRWRMTGSEIDSYFHTRRGSVPEDGLKSWFRDRARKQVRKSSTGVFRGLYSVTAVSPELGLERKLLVCAISRADVVKRVENHQDFRGWKVAKADIRKLPVRVLPNARLKYGII